MNKFAKLAMVALAWGAMGAAQAASSFSASFSLTDGHLPLLLTGNAAFDGPASLPGQWGSSGQIDAVVNTRDLLGTSVDPATGAVSPTWGTPQHSDNMHRAGGPPLSMGESVAYVLGPNEFTQTTGRAAVGYGGLSAQINLNDLPADADAHATWMRSFSLDAHSSFTFSGFASLGVLGDADPLNAITTFDSDPLASFAQLTLGDVAGRVRTSIGASLLGLGGVFSYATNPNGLLALTITNTGDTALRGALRAGSYVNIDAAVAAPVPEPEAWLAMLMGLCVVGNKLRKRQPAQNAA